MSKLLKKISIIFTLLLTCVFNVNDVYAASASVSLSASSSNVNLNNTVTVNVTVSESGGKLGSWNYEIAHDSSKLTLISGSEGQYGEVGDGSITSKSYTLKYKAIAPGSASIRVTSADIRDWDSEQSLSVNKGSITINVLQPSAPSTNNSGSSSNKNNVTKSSDNNLKSLSIDGANLIPEFNKDTLEYNVELSNDTTKIKVNAQANDSKASVSGTGEIEIKEGQNKIQVVVTAENGSSKTYIINAFVKEKDPIKVKVSGEEYTVVRKLDGITLPQNFTEKDVYLENETVKGCYNPNIDYTLVALKDAKGDVNFYVYDLNKSTYSKYNMITSSSLSVVLSKLENEEEIPHNYYKTKFMYDNEEVEGYALSELSDFRVVYGINVETGEKRFYLYDIKENTIQRFYNDQVNAYVDLIQKCKLAFLILGIFIIFLTIIIIVLLSKNVKFKTNYLNSRLNPIDNPKYKEIKYQDLEGTRVMNKVDEKKNKKNKKEKTFLEE